jgi:D-lactate dehydrogenase (cytochrome)
VNAADKVTSLRAKLRGIVGDSGLIDDERAAPMLAEPRGLFHGRALAIVQPASVDEVSAVMRACWEADVPMVPQGGNTGLVGGAIASEAGNAVVISTARLNRIRALDAANDTMIAEAGCILAHLQEAASAADRLFPLSLGAEGSCQIGGNLSANAGGILTLRYGNARDLVLGLEAVLPDGRVWNGLNGLRKNNTGYDLKHLFIGAEGTLGIVTAAVLKLFPKPVATATALVGLESVESALALLGRARAASDDRLSAYELMPRRGLEFAVAHAGAVDPLPRPHGWYVLLELQTANAEFAPAPVLENLLEAALAERLVEDAAIAASEAQRAAFWRIREGLVEAQKAEGGSIKHDIAVPVSSVPAFIAEASAAVAARLPGVRPVPFGHMADGNIHFNLSQPVGMDRAAFLALWDEMNETVHAVALRHGGSISAEHGIGRLKVAGLEAMKSATELDLMRAVKRAIDPKGLMNPGKVLRA